jgi:hypothetical protein
VLTVHPLARTAAVWPPCRQGCHERYCLHDAHLIVTFAAAGIRSLRWFRKPRVFRRGLLLLVLSQFIAIGVDMPSEREVLCARRMP